MECLNVGKEPILATVSFKEKVNISNVMEYIKPFLNRLKKELPLVKITCIKVREDDGRIKSITFLCYNMPVDILLENTKQFKVIWKYGFIKCSIFEYTFDNMISLMRYAKYRNNDILEKEINKLTGIKKYQTLCFNLWDGWHTCDECSVRESCSSKDVPLVESCDTSKGYNNVL